MSSVYHLGPISNIFLRHMDGFLTQWYFHRVKEHPNRSSNEEVMTFRSWRSYVVNLDELTELTSSYYMTSSVYHLCLTPSISLRHMNRFLTQGSFHSIQEHQNRSSDEEVMTFRSWRSYVVNLDELTELTS